MAEPHVLTGLIAKRAEIAGQIERAGSEIKPKEDLRGLLYTLVLEAGDRARQLQPLRHADEDRPRRAIR